MRALRRLRAKHTLWRNWNQRITAIGRRLRESCASDEEIVG